MLTSFKEKWIAANMRVLERKNTHCASHLELGELFSLVARIFCVYKLGEEELVELRALRKTSRAE